MACGKKRTSSPTDTRALLLAMYDKLVSKGRDGKDALLKQRLAQCTHASECGRLCERLVKAPGKSQVFCVNIDSGEKIELYLALGRLEFECPEGRF